MNTLRGRQTFGTGLVLLACLALAPPAFAIEVFDDPTGDLIGLGHGPDATALLAEDQGNTLRLSIELTDPGMATETVGLIEIDTGQSPQSGATSRISLLCPKATGLTVNRTIDLFARHGSAVPVLDAADDIIGYAHWEPTDTGFSVTVDKILLGLDTGLIGVAAIIGYADEATDCVPDGGDMTHAGITLNTAPDRSPVAVPSLHPAALLLLFSILVIIGRQRLQRDRRQ
ncbi:hypothetical protein [Thioalkalivibrio thiocyanodenitrificans]|uniref:hypothetical protein n=1 Tax=Thioalkalivibrio thiocyanodenitrificans TaxID=243063 RepID=UPI0003A5B461|nr:hypothetical protein [Thioalkalivibrio thiocyanodenitrificans]